MGSASPAYISFFNTLVWVGMSEDIDGNSDNKMIMSWRWVAFKCSRTKDKFLKVSEVFNQPCNTQSSGAFDSSLSDAATTKQEEGSSKSCSCHSCHNTELCKARHVWLKWWANYRKQHNGLISHTECSQLSTKIKQFLHLFLRLLQLLSN